MKRTILIVVLILSAVFGAYGQSSSPVDLVLLLDTSTGMSSSYENVNNYLTGPFLTEFLRVGDTFHLIPFSANPRLDVARRINGIGDVETIIGRMLLQYPVEKTGNIGSAITYAEQYVTSLPSRPKKIVLVTVGASDTNNLVNASKQRLGSRATFDYVQVTPGRQLSNLPSSGRPAPAARAPSPSSSSTQTVTAAPSTQAVTSTAAQGSTSRSGTASGTNASTDAAPGTTSASTGTTSASSGAASTATATGSGTTSGATDTSRSGGASTSARDSGTTPPAGSSAETTQTAADTSTSRASTGSSVTGTAEGASQTDSQPSGTTQPVSDSSGSKSENVSTSESGNTKQKNEKERKDSISSSIPLIIGIIIGVLLLLGLIILLASRRLGSSPNRVMRDVSSSESAEAAPFKDHSKDLASYAAGSSSRRTTPYDDRKTKTENVKQPVINPSGPLLLNLFVEDQNTSIGKRNIHSLKTGYSLSLGGGKADDYLIFLVPMPPALGEIRREGATLTFIPKKPKYFPDIGSNQVSDCINKTIRIVSDKKYEMHFRFEMYEDPLVALNRMLMSVKVPG
ncbi:MAG: hypothetical protein FWB95_01290 [Treponema sp.]|nr:hypothetical protein [Treponema sp.]